MKKKINIWTLTFDDSSGLGCRLFDSESKLFDHLGEIMLRSIQDIRDDEADLIRSQIGVGDFDSAYPTWSELYRNELDSYSWDCREFELDPNALF